MKYRIKHRVYLIAYSGKYKYYSINPAGNVEFVFAETLEYARNHYIDHGITLLPF